MADRIISYQTPAQMQPEEDRSFFASTADQYLAGPTFLLMGKAVTSAATFRTSNEPDYKWSDNIPIGNEDFADQYAYTQSREEAGYVTNMIRIQQEAEERVNKDSIRTQLLSGAAAGLLDPTTYIPIPGTYGVGLLKGIGKGIMTQGAVAAGYDFAGQLVNPVATPERTAALIGGDLFFGAAFGGITGGIAPRVIGPVAKYLGYDGLGMKAPVEGPLPGEKYLKAHSDNELFLTERIKYNDTPMKWQEHAGNRIDIIDALPERDEIIPAGFRDVDPEINNPIYHGTRSKSIDSFVDDDGNLRIYNTENMGQTRVSFANEFSTAARYANEVPGGSDPSQGFVFEIDADVVPNLRSETMGEVFSPAPEQIRLNVAEAINDPSLLPETALVIPAGRWRALSPGEESSFVPPTSYRKFFPEQTVTLPVQEAVVKINIPEILGEFESLPTGVFRDRTEWLNYNVNYVLNTKYMPQLDGESASAFARRIEAKTMDDVKAGRVPFNPGTTFAEKMAMFGTHHLPAVRAFGDDEFGMTTYEKIISDFAMTNMANYHNRPSVDSVKMRVARRAGESKLLYSRRTEAAYASYISGDTVPENKYMNIISNFKANTWFMGNKVRDGKVDKPTFRSMISAAAENPDSSHFNGMPIPDEAREAATTFRGILDGYEKIITDYGMSNQSRQIDGRLKSLKSQQSGLERAIKNSGRRVEKDLSASLQKVTAEIADVELEKATLKELKMVPRGVMSYVPHVWRLDAISDRREEFTKKLADLFAKDQFEGAEDRAKRWVAKLIDGVVDEEDAMTTSNGILYLNHRQINASFDDFGDFLETDSDILLTHYLQKMVPAIEMHAMFGDRAMRNHLDEMRTHLQIKYKDLPEKERLTKIGDSLQVLEDARDMILGTFAVTEAHHASIRIVRLAKGLSVLAHMGGAVLSAMTDPVKTAMVNGFSPTLKAALAHLDSSASGLAIARGQAKAAGQAMEWVRQSTLNRWSHGESLIRPNGTMIERGIEKSIPGFFQANLLTPWTVVNKEFAGMVGSHVLITDIVKVAKAVSKGKKVDAKTLRVLASYGISERDAVIIARQPIEQTGSKLNRLYLANTTKWSGTEGDYAREKFLSALYGKIQGSVITPGEGDVGRLFSGVVYKSKARYGVEKQISDLDIERSKIYDTISDIRSGKFVPELPPKPMLLGEPGTFQDLYAANRDKPIMPFKEAIPTGRQPLQLGEPGTFQDLYAANRDKPIMPFKEGIPVGRQPLTLGTPGTFQDFYRANANKPIRGFKEAIPVKIPADQRNIPDPAVADAADTGMGYSKDEMIAPYLEQLSDISRRQAELKSSAARVGRGGSPFLSLPLQFMSFAVASGPKLAHSILTDRDKSRAMGILALISTSYLVAKMKTNEQTWEDMPFEQRVYQAIDRSGITGWLSIAGGTLETHDMGMGALRSWKDPYPPTLGRKVGSILGPTAGDVTSVVDALSNPEHSGKDAARMIRRVIPGNNLLYVKYLFDAIGDAIGEYATDPTVVRPRDLRAPNLPSSTIPDADDFYDLGNNRPAPEPMPIPPDEPFEGRSATVANPDPVAPAPMVVGNITTPEPSAPAPALSPVSAVPIVEGNPGARDQPTLPARAAAPAEPPAQPELPVEAAAPPEEAAPVVEESTKPAAAPLKMPAPEGNPGARDQTAWALTQKPRTDFVNNFTAAVAAASPAEKPAEAPSSGEPVPNTPSVELPEPIGLDGPFKDVVSESNPQYGLMWIKNNSQNSDYKKLASAILENGLGKTTVVNLSGSYNVAGLATFENDGATTVMLTTNDGHNEETFLHELLHAYVQQRWMTLSNYNERNKSVLRDKIDRNDSAVKEFRDIWRSISANIKRNADPDYIKNNIEVSEFLSSPDEGLSYVMTNPDLKDYLKTIDVNGENITPESEVGKTMFDRFSVWLAESLNLPPTKPTRNALDELMSKGNNLIDAGRFVKPDAEFGKKIYAYGARSLPPSIAP
jgi:hypothetical protein